MIAGLFLLREVTHWTQSGPADDQRASTVQIVVEEIIKDAAGAVVLKTKAELPEVGERAFVFKVSLLCLKLTSVTQLLPCTPAGCAMGESSVTVLAISKPAC